MSAVESVAALPLGPAIVLATLLWAAARIAAAVIESKAFGRLADRTGEVLHHLDATTVAVGDLLTEMENVGKDVAAVRDAVESHDPRGGAR